MTGNYRRQCDGKPCTPPQRLADLPKPPRAKFITVTTWAMLGLAAVTIVTCFFVMLLG